MLLFTKITEFTGVFVVKLVEMARVVLSWQHHGKDFVSLRTLGGESQGPGSKITESNTLCKSMDAKARTRDSSQRSLATRGIRKYGTVKYCTSNSTCRAFKRPSKSDYEWKCEESRSTQTKR